MDREILERMVEALEAADLKLAWDGYRSDDATRMKIDTALKGYNKERERYARRIG